MFINIEDNLLKLYELKIGNNKQVLLTKLSMEGVMKHESYLTSNPVRYDDIVLTGKEHYVRRDCIAVKTGKIIEHNDFNSEAEEEYKQHMNLYKVPKIYEIIGKIINDDYSELETLSSLIQNVDELAIKYHKEIDKLIYLRMILVLPYSNEQYNLLLKASKGDLKTKLSNLNAYLNIYHMDLSGIKIKIKK